VSNKINKEEVEKILERRQFLFLTISSYISANILFHFANKFITPDFHWSNVVLALTTPVIFFHIIHTIFFEMTKMWRIVEKMTEKWAKKREELGIKTDEVRKRQVTERSLSFLAHLFTYLFGNLLFFLCIFFFLKDFRWLTLSVSVWGIVVLIHYLNLLYLKSTRKDIWVKKKLENLKSTSQRIKFRE